MIYKKMTLSTILTAVFLAGTIYAESAKTIIHTSTMAFECYSNAAIDKNPGCNPMTVSDKLKKIGCQIPYAGGLGGGPNTAKIKTSDGKVWPNAARFEVKSSNCYFAPSAGNCRDQNAKSTFVMTQKGTAGDNTMICVCDVKSH